MGEEGQETRKGGSTGHQLRTSNAIWVLVLLNFAPIRHAPFVVSSALVYYLISPLPTKVFPVSAKVCICQQHLPSPTATQTQSTHKNQD